MAQNASAAAAAAPASAYPSWEAEMSDLKTNLDQFFVISCSFIIFFMQTGFALLEAGSVRSKNTTNILMKNTLDLLIGGMAYWATGYALAYSDGNAFVGYNHFFATNMPDTGYARWFYGFCFTSTAATIISGAVAERCSFVAYLSYTSLLSGIVYPVVAHWAWTTNGWLTVYTGFHDFSGTGVVHLVGGSAAFVACIILGPRIGLIDSRTGRKKFIPGHSAPLASLGFFILLFGFVAFNGSSVAGISHHGDGAKVSIAVTNTVLSAAAAGLATLMFRRAGLWVDKEREENHWSFLLTVNGGFVGAVSICSGCDVFQTWQSVLTGVIAAQNFLMVRYLTGRVNWIDDPLDTIPVHFTGGWWGLTATGLLHPEGLLMAGGYKILLWNWLGALCIMTWSAGVSGTWFMILRTLKLYRVTEEQEVKGLDMTKHNEPAYPLEAWIDDAYCICGRSCASAPDNNAGSGMPIARLSRQFSRQLSMGFKGGCCDLPEGVTVPGQYMKRGSVSVSNGSGAPPAITRKISMNN